MLQKEKKRWYKIQNFLKKLLLFIFFFILTITVFVLLFFLPDLILSFRYFLYNKLHTKINLTYVYNSNTYIQMMISIISCCITAVLSFFTYRLTRILRMMESEQYGAKLSMAASRLKKNIKNNCWIIFNAKNNIDTIEKLQYISNLDETWFVLREADEINKEDLDFLEKYNDQIREMKECSGTTDQTKNLEIEFCKVFTSVGSQFEYSNQTEKLMRKLDKIIERRSLNE